MSSSGLGEGLVRVGIGMPHLLACLICGEHPVDTGGDAAGFGERVLSGKRKTESGKRKANSEKRKGWSILHELWAE